MLNKRKVSNLVEKKVMLTVVSMILLFTLSSCGDGSFVTTDNPLPTDEVTENVDDKEQDLDGNDEEGEEKEEKEEEEEEIEPVKARALYLTAWTVGHSENVEKYIDLAKNTEVNSYVIDIKCDDGYVGYESNIPKVRELETWMRRYDVESVLQEFNDNDIYTIGRLVVFKDPLFSSHHPEWAVKMSDGSLYTERNGATWIDPYRREAWPYIIDIAREALEFGFDEIQFDYIRFPNDGNKSAMRFNDDGSEKYEIINEFLSYAREELPDAVLSADVFGIILETPKDVEDIGQYLELVGMDIDYISPMIYPSHYAVGQKVNGVQFMKPDFEPYEVVYQSLVKGKERISEVEGYMADMRPYLQAFTASWLGDGYYQRYGAEQMKEQIQAVYDAGYEEWIFWDPENKYPEEAFYSEE
ncbi:putative glycoside hydrolase [Herbivorax sp. ANBcel31]|uniref:putative glycoside hydrolase n=1 Tax=Herbivorax sp. ANBcel31 TaxID=3069754 RepID=UPI0027B261B3|nr:putative glycoside hydrolase [Herbivorax sp. ANBcel31]MDQ2087577.1 putative glycoside hydrolase [Herbivorax sp. ANBcel31]